MPLSYPYTTLPETPPRIHRIPRLETPRFDSLSFRSILPEVLGDVSTEEHKQDPSSIELSCDPGQYISIRDTAPEWARDQDVENEYSSEDSHSRAHSLSSVKKLQKDCLVVRAGSLSSLLPESRRFRVEGGPSLEDFLISPSSSSDSEVGICIRRSDGRIYAIKKMLQTRRAWTELAILEKVKDVRNSFCPLLHWTFENGRYIYVIMDNYPSGTLADAIGRYGVFGPLEVFFYACEIIMGLCSLHDAGIAHRNISPGTIIFDRHGHIILSGLEYGIILRPHGKHLQDTLEQTNKQYRAPEFLLGWNHDSLVDSWSFGMVLYYMFHGKHAFLCDADSEPDVEQLTSKIMCESLPSTAIRFINPIARDLILKCLERNPAMRPNTHDIQRHPYFSNADWGKVVRHRTPAPLPRDFLVSNVTQPSKSSNGARFSTCEQCFSPRVSALGPGNFQQSFGQAAPQFLRSPFATPGVREQSSVLLSNSVQPLAQSTTVLDQVSYAHVSDILGQEQKDNSPRSEELLIDRARAAPCTRRPLPDIWETLDHEEQLSVHSDYSLTTPMKMSFSRAWSLRKERSLIYPHRFFNLSTASIQQKLRKRPKSVAAFRCSAYAEQIADLPSGLSQIGSGIGFTYTTPPPAAVSSKPPVSKTSATTTVPRGPDVTSGSGTFVGVTRNSMASDCTVSVPKACHGLFQSLSMSSFWAGLKSGPVGVSISLPLTHDSAKEGDTMVPHEIMDSSTWVHGSGLPHQVQFEEKGDLQPEFTQPLAESTFLPQDPQEPPSPVATLSSGSITSGEDVLTPDTVDFQRRDIIYSTEQEIVETKRSEEKLGFGPESTLRLVTSSGGLRLSFTSGER